MGYTSYSVGAVGLGQRTAASIGLKRRCFIYLYILPDEGSIVGF
jgi:hypothetical protein